MSHNEKELLPPGHTNGVDTNTQGDGDDVPHTAVPMQALEQEGAVHQEEENKDTADADTVAGRARAMLQRTLSDRINPWKRPDLYDSYRDQWYCIPTVCKAIMALVIIDACLMLAWSIHFFLILDTNDPGNLNLAIALLVGLVAFFVFAIRAILRENVALLGVHLLVCILLVGGAIWWLVKERSMPDTDGTKMGVVSALLPVTVLIVVLEILALRRFGWRTYSQFAIDFRKADAMAARRLWVTSNALTASTYITYISTVLMAITGIVLFAFPSEQDISDAVAVPVLTLNCIGLVFSLVVLTGTLWVVRERRRHRWVFMADLGLALMYSVPIINYVLMKTSVTAPGDTTETMAVIVLTITWGLLHLVLYQWSTLDKSVMDALSQPTDTESAAPELIPLLQGAWLNRPGNVITKRKYFFQLSADKTVLRWSWHKWVDLRYVDALEVSATERKINIKLAAESDLLLRYDSLELYDKWKRGLEFLLSELLGDVEVFDMDAGESASFSQRHASGMMGSMSSAPSEESVASGFFKRTVRAFSASITMQDPYNVARKVSGRRASSQEKRRRSNLNLHHPALPPTDAVAIEVGESGPDSSPLTSHGGVGGGVLGGGGGTGTVPQGASHMDSGVSHGVHVTGGRKGEMVHGEKDKMKEEKTGNEKRGEKDTEAMVDAFTDAAVDEHHARERRRDELVRQLSNLGVKHRYWASLRAHLPNLLPGSHQRHTSSSGTPTTPGSSWTSKPHPPSGGAFAGTGEGTPTPTPAASGGGDNAQRAQRAPGLSSVVGVGTSQGGRHTEGGTSGAATTSMQQPGGRQDRKRRRTPMELRGVVDAVLLRKPKPPSPAVRPPGGVSPAEHTTTAAGGALGGGGEAMEVDTVGALPALGALPIAAPMVFAPAPAAAAVPGALGAAVPAVPAAGVPPAVPATAPSEGVLELASTATPFDGGAASMWSNQTSTIYGDIWRQLQQMQAEHEATGAAHVPPTMAAGVLDGLQQLLPAQQSLQASPFDANTAQASTTSPRPTSSISPIDTGPVPPPTSTPSQPPDSMLSTSLFTAVLPEHAPSTLTTSEASPVGTSVALSGGAMSSSALEQLTGRAVSLGLPVPLHAGMVVYPNELGPPIQRLGSGAQGEVYLALLRGSQQVAVKVFQGLDDRRNGIVMLHEIEMNLRAGRHPNVVQCKGLCSKSEQELLLIMEYCPRRSFAELLHVMKCKGRHIDPFKLLGFLRSVARGLQYLHSRGILHRDVKPGNCFVGAHQVLKLGDLGHACHVHQGGLELLPPSPDTPEALQWGPSTPEFSAPETWHPLRLPRPLDIQLVLKTDVWSFGVLLWQACMLRNPYDEFGAARRARLLALHSARQYQALRLPKVQPPAGNPPKHVVVLYEELGVLVERCMHPEPSMRPSMSEVVQVLNELSITLRAVRTEVINMPPEHGV